MLNCAVLMGRLTADPVRSVTQTGKEVCSFQIAVDKTVNGERKADFITIVAWEGSAVLVEKYFRKGSMIAIQGSIQTRPYEDKHGNKRTAFEIVAREISFCDDKKTSPSASPPPLLSGEADTSLSRTAEAHSGYFATATAADFVEIVCDDDDYEVPV